jgi:hypothetical protein
MVPSIPVVIIHDDWQRAGILALGHKAQLSACREEEYCRCASIMAALSTITAAELSPESRPLSGQGENDRVQGQPHGRPHYRAVDADVLQIAPQEQFQLA